jgi:hypothetical protein
MRLLPFLRTLVLALVLSLATLVSAQHGMARGFHGGGGHFYGGHYGRGYSGWRGGYHGSQGAYGGWYGGRHGWYGGYWGYPYYGWGYPYYGFGWGISVGFAWSPYWYWPVDPYSYGYGYDYGYEYGAWTGSPDYQRNSSCDFRYSCSDQRMPDCDTSRPGPQARRSVPRPYVNSSAARPVISKPIPNPTVEPPPPIAVDDPRKMVLVDDSSPLRRETQNAVRTLRGMPPAARQRWIDSGKYDRFSPEEQAVLKNISDEHYTPMVTATQPPENAQK